MRCQEVRNTLGIYFYQRVVEILFSDWLIPQRVETFWQRVVTFSQHVSAIRYGPYGLR